METFGRGVPQDFGSAARGFKILFDSRRGPYGAAAYYLGRMAAAGQGIPIDYELAAFYLQEAIASGDSRVAASAQSAAKDLEASLERAAAVNNAVLESIARAQRDSAHSVDAWETAEEEGQEGERFATR